MMDHWEMLDVYKALFALVAGMVLGLEREMKDKAAGLKTITVICLGSTLFAIISYKVGGADHESTRIASYIVSGVGFLGAGVIFKDGVNVSGLTTAGIIWLASAVGMAIGFGEFFVAATFLIACLLIIYSSPWINRQLYTRRQTRNLVFAITKDNSQYRDMILQDIRDQGIGVEEKRLELKEEVLTITAEAVGRHKKMKWLEEYLVHNSIIIHFSL